MRKSWADRLPDIFGLRRIYELKRQLEEAQGENEELAAEMGVISEDFEKDCWRSMKRILKRCEFDWRDIDHDGVTADQAEEFIIETIDDLAARLKRATTPPEPNMLPDDWTVSDTDTAGHILDYLGIGQECSREPGVDRKRDHVAKIIRARIASTSPPQNHVASPADQIIGQIEELFPNWRAYRDLVDCITCELHELRQRAEAGR